MPNPTTSMHVNFGESSELKFMLSIKGSTSDPNISRPNVRFMITENQSGFSVCFPMKSNDDGTVGVTIPDLPHVFREDRTYNAKIEVIVGSKYFVPANMELVFERPMQVAVAPAEGCNVTNKHALDIEDFLHPETPKAKTQSTRPRLELTDDGIPTRPKTKEELMREKAKERVKTKIKNLFL